jgi:DNA replication and repair protein RecF
LPGPSGSLLTVTHSGTGQTAELSSTGEQKALVISVILAHARLQARRLQRPPLLLLDDIASHLDAERRAALYDLTAELAGQVWFSGTDENLFQPMSSTAQFVFLDAGGVIRPAAPDMRSVS